METLNYNQLRKEFHAKKQKFRQYDSALAAKAADERLEKALAKSETELIERSTLEERNRAKKKQSLAYYHAYTKRIVRR